MSEHSYFVVPDPDDRNVQLRAELQRISQHIYPFAVQDFANMDSAARDNQLKLANHFIENDLLQAEQLAVGEGLAATATGTAVSGYLSATFGNRLLRAHRLQPRQRIVGVVDDLRAVFVPERQIIKQHQDIDIADVDNADKVATVAPVLVAARKQILSEAGVVLDSEDLSQHKILLPLAYPFRASLAHIVDLDAS